MDDQQRPLDTPFRAMKPEEYASLDPATRDRIVRTRHLGIIRASEETISAQLHDALTNPRQMPDGTTRLPYQHHELVVVLMHRDDAITPPQLRTGWTEQNIEVGIFVSERQQFAAGISEFQLRQCSNCHTWFGDDVERCAQCGDPSSNSPRLMKPYQRAGMVLKQPSPPNTVYVAVFDMNMCTVTFLGFDPANPDAESVVADPNVPAPRAVDPLPVATPTPKQIEP